MSTAYYVFRKAEQDTDTPDVGELIGVFQKTKPGPTFRWAINPMRLVPFFIRHTWVEDEYHHTMSIFTLFEKVKKCPIQIWDESEIPA